MTLDPHPAVHPTAVDLAANVAGAAARARRDEVNAAAPVWNALARLLRVHTDERAWRVGARGEMKVAVELDQLGPAWRILHAVGVGQRGSDIDHVVIGPPGVFTLNTKTHPNATAWVADRAVRVNGQRTNYLRNSRFESQRAHRLLTAACGQPVAVTPVIVFVDLADITEKGMPPDVHVTTKRRLRRWLTSLPPALSTDAVEAIYAKARLSTTWL